MWCQALTRWNHPCRRGQFVVGDATGDPESKPHFQEAFTDCTCSTQQGKPRFWGITGDVASQDGGNARKLAYVAPKSAQTTGKNVCYICIFGLLNTPAEIRLVGDPRQKLPFHPKGIVC
jgi:hypothetical protein